MRKITFMEAFESVVPQPVSLICTLKPGPDGGTNLAPVAWWTFLESEPPMMGFSMSKESYTCELASDINKKIAICFPGEAIADEVLKCGSVSGRNIDKAKEYGIKLTGEAVKYPVNSKLVFLCTIAQRVVVGDCVFFVCNIDEMLCDDSQRHIYTWGQTQSLRPIPD